MKLTTNFIFCTPVFVAMHFLSLREGVIAFVDGIIQVIEMHFLLKLWLKIVISATIF